MHNYLRKQCFPFRSVLYKSLIALVVITAVARPDAFAIRVKVVIPQTDKVTVSGKVTDNKGLPLPGVTVVEKGTGNGLITDITGSFEIRVAGQGSVLVFTYLGFATKEVIVTGQDTMTVVLNDDAKMLDQVVVVGYGTQKKSDLTGSVSSINQKELADLPVPDIGAALEGRLAGVEVIGSGTPGNNATLQIRGIGSINDANPLVVIDGVPTSSGVNYLNIINPNDIETIDILKDASATAIYGSQGANGVIIITTKKGVKGQSHLNFDFYTGIQSVTNTVKLLNAQQFAQLNNEELTNANMATNPAYANPASLGSGTNWLNALYRNAPMSNYSLSYSGGTEKTDYYVGGSYLNQQGIVIATGYTRYAVTINSNARVLPWLKFGENVTMSHDEKPGGSYNIQNTMAANPVQPIYNPDGSYSGPVGQSQYYGSITNPIALANIVQNNTAGYNMIGSAYAEATIIPGLTFKTSGGLVATFYDSRTWSPSDTLQPSPQTKSYLSEQYNKSWTLNWDNYLTYDKRFNKHHLTLLAGTSAQNNRYDFLSGSITGFSSTLTQQISSGLTNPTTGGDASEWALFSLMGRANYAYDDKYLFTATIRRDGSSRFGDEEKYGVFPSASAAWRVSKEAFFKKVQFVSDLKIRGGYGVTGDQNGIGNYTFASVLTPVTYTFNGTAVPAQLLQTAANPSLSWETIKQSNVGIDASFFHFRVNLTVDAYIKNTTGMLVPYNVPLSTGYTSSADINAGSLQNKGLEITTTTHNLTGAFKWNTSFNISFNSNKITSLDQNNALYTGSIGLNDYLAVNQVGQPVNAFYGYVAQGIFQTKYDVMAHATQVTGTTSYNSTSPGDVRYADLNGDGVINSKDERVIGNPTPKFTYGMTNTFSFKHFDLAITIQGVYGNQIFGANNIFQEAMATAENQSIYVLGRWEGPGTSNTIPRAIYGDPNNNERPSTLFIQDGSYMRIKNVVLGYTIPNQWLQHAKITKIRAYISVQNLYTFTHYTGFDPEVGSNGIDYSTYPVAKIISVGANLTL